MAGLLEGVLPALYSGADQVKRRVKGLLSDPREFLGQRSQDLQTMQDQDSALAYGRGLLSPKDPAHARMARNEPAFNAQQASAAEQRMLDIAMQGLTVYHGSPHKFDKFDMSKIGTGEGAQSYGHGMYFAENPKVAMEYQRKLTDSVDAFDHELGYGVNLGDGKIKWFSSEKAAKDFKQDYGGGLYKVDLPDSAIEKMLDWDKPLSQQPEAVRKFFEPMISKTRAELSQPAPGWGEFSPPQVFDPTGQELLALLRDSKLSPDTIFKNGLDSSVSRRLHSSGIPGIRYLDGGSRGAGSGTRNFVVFDDQLPKILEVNGGLLGR